LKDLFGFLNNLSRNVNGRTEIVNLEIPIHISKFINEDNLDE